MAIDLLRDTGIPLDRQEFDWKELVELPYSKLDDDAFTRIRVILMNGIEAEAVRFSHACARMNGELRRDLARVRRIEQHQQTLVNWLNPGDQSVLETTIGYEQTAIEITAAVAQREPDTYLASVYRFGMLEDFDHLYRYAALMDRLEGLDANNIVQSYTDILPGRPTVFEHRAPEDDIRDHYDAKNADPISKLNALVILSAEHQVHDYYMNVGPTFSDPLARQLYAEIASVEEQHVTQYESIVDPGETWLEKWLLHEANEAYNYFSCLESESNPRLRAIWERMLDYELGHVRYVADLFENAERRDAAEVLPESLPEPIRYESQRDFVRRTLESEANLRAVGTGFVDASEEPPDGPSVKYRERVNRAGSPSERVARGYVWTPGTELVRMNGVSTLPPPAPRPLARAKAAAARGAGRAAAAATRYASGRK
jgi:rubrerythrin